MYDPIQAMRAASYLSDQGIMAYADDTKQCLSVCVRGESENFSLTLAPCEAERFAQCYDDVLERENLALAQC